MTDPLLVLQGHLDGDLHRNRSRVRIKDLREVVARELHEIDRQPRRRLVREPAEHHVAHAIDLLLGGRGKPRVAVPVGGGPPGGHGVDELGAIGKREVDARGRLHDARGRAGLGVGVPDVVGIDCRYVISRNIHQIRSSTHARPL